ncbi:MAG TPA: extracellular solute-binding protein, partial [Oceanithermus profundus]|nr:extracellular solute-binding protein [Oceanithermus profundus]
MRKVWMVLFALALGSFGLAQSLVWWTTENQPKRMEVQRQIAAEFTAKTGIKVEVVPVEENQLSERITAAFAAGQLPDVIFHPLDYTVGWAAQG